MSLKEPAMKIAIVHDWLVTSGGSEKVLEHMLREYPEADVFSLVDFLPEDARGFLLNKKVRTSFIQNLPFARRGYRNYLPLMPLAVEQFDLSGYDLVISNSHAVAKGAFTTSSQTHICYCCTPMRYAWDLQHQYLRESGLNGSVKGFLARSVLHYMRLWDASSASRADHYVAASRYVASKIKKTYGREAEVVYPPVDTDAFTLREEKEDFYLAASRMVPYKRMDLIVEAFAEMPDKKLVVIGDGPEMKKVRAKASRNVELLGRQPTGVLRDYLQRARALVFCAEEDFGIVALEAQACGTPVIAYGKGGSLETVVEGKTGLFFQEQAVGSLRDAVRRFEAVNGGFDPREIRKHAEGFGAEKFRGRLRDFILRHAPNGRPLS